MQRPASGARRPASGIEHRPWSLTPDSARRTSRRSLATLRRNPVPETSSSTLVAPYVRACQPFGWFRVPLAGALARQCLGLRIKRHRHWRPKAAASGTRVSLHCSRTQAPLGHALSRSSASRFAACSTCRRGEAELRGVAGRASLSRGRSLGPRENRSPNGSDSNPLIGPSADHESSRNTKSLAVPSNRCRKQCDLLYQYRTCPWTCPVFFARANQRHWASFDCGHRIAQTFHGGGLSVPARAGDPAARKRCQERMALELS
jgi:hypothetical protein